MNIEIVLVFPIKPLNIFVTSLFFDVRLIVIVHSPRVDKRKLMPDHIIFYKVIF